MAEFYSRIMNMVHFNANIFKFLDNIYNDFKYRFWKFMREDIYKLKKGILMLFQYQYCVAIKKVSWDTSCMLFSSFLICII